MIPVIVRSPSGHWAAGTYWRVVATVGKYTLVQKVERDAPTWNFSEPATPVAGYAGPNGHIYVAEDGKCAVRPDDAYPLYMVEGNQWKAWPVCRRRMPSWVLGERIWNERRWLRHIPAS